MRQIRPIRGIKTFLRMADVTMKRPKPLPKTSAESPEVVVSLTTYEPRINVVHLAIRSLMAQRVPPNRIVLYLGEDSNDLPLPDTLTDLIPFGLEIRRGVHDLRSHKKYYFAFREFPDALVVLADDDLLYTSDVIETLLAGHRAFPHAIVARRVHRIVTTPQNTFAEYGQWEMEWSGGQVGPRKDLLATTGAGTLFPPEVFESLLLYEDDIMRLAPTADDILLKVLEAKAGIPVYHARSQRPMPFFIPGTLSNGLFATTNLDGGNDKTLARLCTEFGLSVSDFAEDDG